MKAELVLFSEAIFDSVKNEPFTGGIAIQKDKIIAIGSRKDITAYIGNETIVKELGDKLVMPGFCDNHGHYSGGADYFFEVACHDLENCNSEEECANMIKNFAKMHPELERYKGQGWDLSYWGDNAKFPTKDSLDKLIPDKPVYLTASDLHSVWMNSKAIEEVQLRERMKNYSKDHILRDKNGEPTGVVREVSHDFTYEDVLTPQQVKSNQRGLIHELNKVGITGFSDVNFREPEQLAESYQYMKEIEKEGKLTLRFYVYPTTHYNCEKINDIDPYKIFFDSDFMKISGLKAIIDGVTATYTAVLLEPYEDAPNTKGVMVESKEKIENWVCEANKKGYGVRIHCIGDGAIRIALDAFEQSNQINNNSKIRNAIEHIEIISPSDINRFKELNVIASMQPRHQIIDKDSKLTRCGIERSRYEWAFRSILDAGGCIALGTDYPVVSFNPYENIYFALTKKGLDGKQYGRYSLNEVMTLQEAIKGYTIAGAYCNGMEEKLGTLEVGKYADITVASENLFKIPVEEIKDCSSLLTIFNGNIVYEQ